jgi:hypothetical protein
MSRFVVVVTGPPGLTREATVDVIHRGLVDGDYLLAARSSGSRERAEA